MAQSLFKACKQVIRDGISGTKDVGGYDVFIEYYTQEDIDENVRKIKYGEASKCTFGDTDESKVVLVASPVLTIPSGFTLTPASPKKSLVVICNTLINEGTISMTAKAPNVLPHDWYLVGKVDGYSENVVIPAYANNGTVSVTYNNREDRASANGGIGVARQCGGGGSGRMRPNGHYYGDTTIGASGQGYSFGGGAGSGGYPDGVTGGGKTSDVDKIYPMRGGSGSQTRRYTGGTHVSQGGIGNPVGIHYSSGNWENTIPSPIYTDTIQPDGCGGRIIIFCNTLINNNSILSKGTNSVLFTSTSGPGGASGGGAIDLFVANFDTIGNINADGGLGVKVGNYSSGNGGNGSITYSDGDQAPLWIMPDIFKPREKYMSKDNMIYFLGELVKRINND